MSNHAYLSKLLVGQDLAAAEERTLRNLRDGIQMQLGRLAGSPRFYYAGSYAKRTLIREKYDLDIVAYWPYDSPLTVKGIFDAVGAVLKQEWKYVVPKNVAWELPFEGGFHIDVVSGRAIDSSYYEANLYRRDKDSTLKTSLKKHIDTIRNSGRRDAIRLMKLWKIRRKVPIKTFVLELLVIEGCKGATFDNLEPQLLASLRHIRDQILDKTVLDPANSSNVISESMSMSEKVQAKVAAQNAIDAKLWSDVFAKN